MSKALSVDLRVRVFAAVAGGLSHRQAGERFGVSAASVSRWRRREREQGDCRPLALGGDRRSHGIERHAETILGIAAANDRDITLAEIKAAHASEQNRPDIMKRRQDWFDDQPGLDPERLVFIDETWASTNMARRHNSTAAGYDAIHSENTLIGRKCPAIHNACKYSELIPGLVQGIQ